MDSPGVNRASFSLEPEYRDMLRRIAYEERRTQTEILRMLIDFYADAKGYGAINPIDPKTFSPVLEMA